MTARYWIEKPVLLDVVRVLGHPCAVSEGEQLAWSSAGRIPEVGEMVHVILNGFGDAKVVGYFQQDGYLGLLVEPKKLPEWYVKQSKGREVQPNTVRGWHQICVFGAEIRRV